MQCAARQNPRILNHEFSASTPTHGQKTGYFLDQKDNRRIAADFCHGKKVLDTFTHTGAFGLNAFKAGARDVTSVDISEEVIARASKLKPAKKENKDSKK